MRYGILKKENGFYGKWMNQSLFAVGLLIFGFSLMILMPASMIKSWRELDFRPPAGGAVIMLMRALGLFIIVSGLVILSGIVDITSVMSVNR
ncbi:hypothetical protein MNBD_NITROSPINAE04-1026 [hydrothermal vent metagenome]|uniref:Uncharacterized protein n=1 Tax=hydrothermal vent metagenome TaxID=652676 RepID=A0A3B1BRJ1_9ZZZZ